jgi:hypothetical protein
MMPAWGEVVNSDECFAQEKWTVIDFLYFLCSSSGILHLASCTLIAAVLTTFMLFSVFK